MRLMKPTMSVLEGGAGKRVRAPLEAAYDHFRLERQGDFVSPATLEHYDAIVVPFLAWVTEAADVRRFDDLDVGLVRAYRVELATRPGKKHRRPLQARTIFHSHRTPLLTFFRWARAEGYAVESRILELKRPRVPEKEPTIFHIRQVREILAACNTKVPQEELAVRILLGSGVRESELCGCGRPGWDVGPDARFRHARGPRHAE
jgi:site-specific recombinase XerD